MLGFGPFCLDLGHIAWIWAIWQNLGQYRPQRRQSPEDGAGRDSVYMDGQIPPVFYRTSSPLGPLPKKRKPYYDFPFREFRFSAVTLSLLHVQRSRIKLGGMGLSRLNNANLDIGNQGSSVARFE